MSTIYAPVEPILRIPDVEVDKEYLVQRALRRFEEFEADRVEWLGRREEYYLGWDDYQSSTRKGLWDGSSNVHLPFTEIQCNLMHARMMQAFFFMEPWFYIEPQEEIDLERIQKIELEMKYILTRYANYHQGVYLAIDDWCWDIVTEGIGILHRDWKVLQRRHVRTVENEDFKKQRFELERLLTQDVRAKDFEKQAANLIKYPYKEESVIRTIFNGPLVSALDPAYVLFRGDAIESTDLNNHETVICVCYFTRDDLIGFKQSQFMDEDAIDQLLESKPISRGSGLSGRNSRVQYARDRQTGVNTLNPNHEANEYEVLCVYDRVAINGKPKESLADEVVYFVSTQTQSLLRWTFLDRISTNGKRPLHMAHLYRRPRRTIGRGMVETQYPLNDTMDLLVNQSIDAGLLANQPMFGYRGNSTFDPEQVKITPGLGLRMDDPNNDLRFFNMHTNPSWSMGIQSMLQNMGQQYTSLGPISSGQMGQFVGPLRSNAGVKSLLSETGTNLDVILKRLKIPYSEFMEGIYSDCVSRMPQTVRRSILGTEGEPVLGEDGAPLTMEISREDLSARIHFGLYANSQNMNRLAMQDAAMQLSQFLLQRINIETGIVKPENIYEICMNVVKAMGVQKAYRFLSKPQNSVALPLTSEIFMIMQGLQPPVVLNDPEHQAKIDKMTEIMQSDETALEVQYGKVHKDALQLLSNTIKEHQRYLLAVQRPTNLENPTGANISPTAGGSAAAAPEEQGAGGGEEGGGFPPPQGGEVPAG